MATPAVFDKTLLTDTENGSGFKSDYTTNGAVHLSTVDYVTVYAIITTMKDLISQYVGKMAYIHDKGLRVEVEIIDIKNVYGRIRYQVKPVAGNGERWVEQVVLKERFNKKK